MKIAPFITLYKTKKTPDDQVEFVKEHIKADYVPFEKKADIAKAITQASYYVKEKDINNNEIQKFRADSVAKYMLTCMALIDLYTDIDRNKNEGKMLEDFNKLNEHGIFDVII